MPFCIWVTRADSYEARNSKAASGALDRGMLDDMLDVVGTAREHPPDRSYWLFHPDDMQPWLSLFPHESGGELRHVELSVSFSSPIFPRNLAGMFYLALQLAEWLDARVFEEQGGREVTTDNIDELLDVKGSYVKGLVSFWRGGRQRLLTENHAPFELPLGAIDSSSDYFTFQLSTGGSPPPLAELTAGTPEHLKAYLLEHSAVLEHVESGEAVVRILRLDEEVWVRPYWSDLPFATLADETLGALDRIAARLHVVPQYFGVSVDTAKREAIATHARGLGVEYFEWLMR